MNNDYIKNGLLSLLFVIHTALAFSQNGTVRGVVYDENKQTLPGASVFIKELGKSVGTDAKGQFILSNLPKGKYTLVVSFIGYASKEERLNYTDSSAQLSIQLQPTAEGLDEVVVIGYGTQKKGELTGSVTTVNSKDFQKGVITSPEQLIAGKAAGVQITPNSGQPGSGSTIRIRGGASLNASNDPLIVVDGVPLATVKNNDGTSAIAGVANPLSLINPNDIETFTVLKDANATAIYGSRASNGVILITTKKGLSGAPVINFSTQNSLASASRRVNVLTADQIRTFVSERGTDRQKALMGTANTDWQDQIYRKAFTTDNNLSIAGTVRELPYRVSVGYMNQDGILKRDNMQRTTAAINLSPKLFDNHLKIDLNLKGSYSKSQFANQDAIKNAVQFDPTQTVHAENGFGNYFEWLTTDEGSVVPNPNAPRNPVALLELKNDEGQTLRSLGNVQLDYSFHFLPELHANLNLGYDVSRGKGNTFVPSFAAQNASTLGYYKRYLNDISNKVIEFYLQYNKDLISVRSNINATAGYGFYDNKKTNNNYPTYQGDRTTVVSQPIFPFDIPRNRLLSYYGRLIYTYDDRYILSGTIRTDGSSRFSEDSRWGVFPSAAFTWRAINEEFLRDNAVLSDLKLRLSYGVTGQQEGIANYSYLPNYYSSGNESMYQMGDTFYYMNTPIAYDKDIKWETTETYNAGIDYGFLDGRIYGSLDVYYKKTKDLLSSIPIPVGANFSNYLLTNVGNMENKGVEFNLNATTIKNESLTWDLGFNFTYNDNKVINLTAVEDPSFMVQQGGITGATGNYIQAHTLNRRPYSFYVYKQIYDERGKPLEGVYADLNKDGTVTPDDRYFYQSPAPKFIFGFSTSVNYKKWTLNTVLRANVGNYIYDNVSSNLGTTYNILSPSGINNNSTTDVLFTNFSINQYQSDYYIKNASFLKMDNLGLSYQAGKIFNHSKLNLGVSANVQNVFVISKYKGVDPELSNGIDYNLYPRPRTFVLGLNVGF